MLISVFNIKEAALHSGLIRITFFAFLFVFIASFNSMAAGNQRLALVIGNSNYSFASLKNPVNDASDIAAALQKQGFTVTLKKNAGLREMEEAVRDFGKRLKQGGVGLFYYAGHGLQVEGINYLVPVNARISKDSDVKYETMDAGMILDEMANANNGLNIVILDACRDNPFSRSFRSVNRGLAVVGKAPVGSYISYSTGPGQVALDGEGRNSPFAHALMQYMTMPGLVIEEVFKNVRQKLNQDTGGKQIPWELSSLQGDFFFDSSKRTTAGAVQAISEKKAGTEPVAVAGTSAAKPKKDLPPAFTDPFTAMEFILVKGGCFQMGDNFGEGDNHERPVHEVCLDSYYMGKHEVTQGQWGKVMKNNPSHFRKCGDPCPVESVAWTDAMAFIAELNSMSGQKYRLPTEAEWEFSARDGGRQEKWAGTSSDVKLDEYAWYDANSDDRTHPVGLKKPNGLGLYDMSGNVWEWTQDRYGRNYYQTSPRDNPPGPEDGTMRVLRGGCWLDRSRDCRASIRFLFPVGNAFKSIGFRLVREAY